MIESYPFRFVQNFKESNSSRLLYKRLYSFKSTKSNECSYLLIRKSELLNNSHLMNDLELFFTAEYDYFE